MTAPGRRIRARPTSGGLGRGHFPGATVHALEDEGWRVPEGFGTMAAAQSLVGRVDPREQRRRRGKGLMNAPDRIRGAVNGYSVIGNRVTEAVTQQEDMERAGIGLIVQGGEKHEVTGRSFVADADYASAVGRDATRVVPCNTTSVVRTLTLVAMADRLTAINAVKELMAALGRSRENRYEVALSIRRTDAALGIAGSLI